MSNNIVCGIDVSKDQLDVHLHPIDKFTNFANNKQGIALLIKYLTKYEVSKVICEATGGYEKNCAYALKSHINTYIVNAGFIRSYAKALGYLAKTDKIDAKVIAMFGANDDISKNLHALPDIDLSNLKELLLRRDQLIEILKIQKTQLKQLRGKTLVKQFNKLMAILTKQILDLENSMTDIINSQPDLLKKYQQIISIKGIGKITALTMLISLPELGKLSHKSITKLAGLAPMNRDSGTKKGKRFIQGGRKEIRRVLYMAVMSAIRHNKNIKEFFDRLTANKKPFKIAATAAMRKLLYMVNAVIRDNRMWQESIN